MYNSITNDFLMEVIIYGRIGFLGITHTSVRKTLLPSLNFVNCWNAMRAKITTAELEMVNAMVEKYFGFGNQQPSAYGFISYGEGSETIPCGVGAKRLRSAKQIQYCCI
jgi:hypothetical protein